MDKGTDHAILLQDLATGKRRRFEGPTAAVVALAFSADGKTLASVGRDQTVRSWEVATGKERQQCRIEGWLLSEEDEGRMALSEIRLVSPEKKEEATRLDFKDGVYSCKVPELKVYSIAVLEWAQLP